MMDRRTFLAGTGAVLLAAPLVGEGQQVPRIVLVVPGSAACLPSLGQEAFSRRLSELGYVPGTNLVVDRRCYGAIAEVPGILAEVLRLKPDVIVAGDSQAAVAAKKATATTPIVFMNSSDPVRAGLIASFARPGGNATGVGNLGRELTEKRVELLKQAVPSLARVGVVWNLTNEVHEAMWKSEFNDIGRRAGVAFRSLGVRSASDIERAFSRLREQRVEAVLLMPDGLLFAQRNLIVRLASQNRLPTSHWGRGEVEAGGLMSYGPNPIDVSRQAAVFVGKILKGAKPGELPVEQPTTFELVINLKTAKALGLTIPPSLLQRADKIIQ
jgi:putative tryptophan/tyrosine transport system substrate-binding protein